MSPPDTHTRRTIKQNDAADVQHLHFQSCQQRETEPSPASTPAEGWAPLTSSALDGSPHDPGGKIRSSKADTRRAGKQVSSTLQGLNA